MSGLSTPFYGTLKGYWSLRTRRRYQRLNKTTAKKGNNQRAPRFGARKRALLSLWRSKLQVRVIRRQLLWLRSRAGIVSPVKLIGSLRNAYIDLMLRLAGNVGSLSTGNAFSDSRRVADAGLVSRTAVAPCRVDIDQEKLVFEIYRILAASQ